MYDFHDTLPINDSLVHGFVVAEDGHGNVIFKKSNMVVNGGRDSIIALIKNTMNGNTAETGAFKTFSSIKFGSNYSMTIPTTNSITTLNNDIYQYAISLKDDKNALSNEDENAICEYDKNNRYFKITVNVSAGSPAEIRELGLYFKDINENEKLFSRVVFDPIFCGANAAISTFTVTYYVYL